VGGDVAPTTPLHAYAGIDVAFARGKRLPIVVCIPQGGRLQPLPLRRRDGSRPPIGRGNPETINDRAVADFAGATVEYLRWVEREHGVSIRRVALDSPSDPRNHSDARRCAESALDEYGIHCITTPSASDFEIIRRKVREHLDRQGAVSRLPHANQLWMLVGFELFRRLRNEWECLEVFPQATASLEPTERMAFGRPPNDVIWVPACAAARNGPLNSFRNE
jgi:hypothetical protein